jgi:hypothetical protein
MPHHGMERKGGWQTEGLPHHGMERKGGWQAEGLPHLDRPEAYPTCFSS